MKRKLLCIMLAASLILSVVMPATALAAKGNAPAPPKTVTEFESTMTVTWIEDTLFYQNVFPLDGDGAVIPPEIFFPNPGLVASWQVVDRHMTGEVSGSIEGTLAITYSAMLNPLQEGAIWGTIELDTKPGTNRGVIYGTFEGYTATVYFDPELWIADVVFMANLNLSGGTGIYRHIEGEVYLSTGMENPIRLYLDSQGHVLNVVGSMTIEGTYVRVSKP